MSESAISPNKQGPQVYVVHYTTGEYSSRIDYPVRAFMAQEKAKLFAEAHNERLLARGCHRSQEYDGGATYETRELVGKELDVGIDYTGGDYYLAIVPLDTEVDA